jgi:hypothetical protein
MTEPNVYQASNDTWIVFNNGIKSEYFNTVSEAVNMATKLIFAGQAQDSATTMATLGDKLADLHSVYFDRGYNSSGGSNPITDDDLSSLGITAVQLANLITLAEQFANFLNNAAVIQADYDATLNAIRTDI